MRRAVAALALTSATLVFGTARALDRDVRGQIMHGVVCLVALQAQKGSDKLQPVARGSGTIVSTDGVILTNNHVIADEKSGKRYDYIAVGFTRDFDQAPEFTCLAPTKHARASAKLDLALIQCELDARGAPLAPAQSYPAVSLGDSARLIPGDNVYVIGYPGIGGATINFTAGKVSGFIGEDQGAGRDWIKTDASLAGGNSGGAAIDDSGTLVGVPTRIGDIEKRGEYQIGQVNYLRPINKVKDLLAAPVADEGDAAPSQPVAVPPAAAPRPTQTASGDDDNIAPVPAAPLDPYAAPAPAGVIAHGRIVAAESGKPIAGAVVIFLKPGVVMNDVDEDSFAAALYTKAITDSRGRFSSERPLARGQKYGVVVVAKKYRAVGEDNGVAPVADTPAQLDLGTIKLRRQ